jgi:hypothetical protein
LTNHFIDITENSIFWREIIPLTLIVVVMGGEVIGGSEDDFFAFLGFVADEDDINKANPDVADGEEVEEVFSPSSSYLRFMVEFQWFLMALSVRPEES